MCVFWVKCFKRGGQGLCAAGSVICCCSSSLACSWQDSAAAWLPCSHRLSHSAIPQMPYCFHDAIKQGLLGLHLSGSAFNAFLEMT